MDASRPEIAIDDDIFMEDIHPQPIPQHFDDSLSFLQQLGSEFSTLRDFQFDMRQFETEWLRQPEENISQSFEQSYEQSFSAHFPTSIPPHASLNTQALPDLVDYIPSLEALETMPAAVHPIETNMNSLIAKIPDVTGDHMKKHRRCFIDDNQKAILSEWIARNPEPYPSKDDKISLAASTGLTVNQISNWFTRTRQRKLNRIRAIGTLINTEGSAALIEDLGRKHFVTPERSRSLRSHNSMSPLTFEGSRLRSASLPPPKHYAVRTPPKRSLSLPPSFTLNSIGPYTSTRSRSSHSHLSLEALASTHRSSDYRESNKGKRKHNKSIQEYHSHPHSYEETAKKDLIEMWVADMVQRTAYPSQWDGIPLATEPINTPAESDYGDIDSNTWATRTREIITSTAAESSYGEYDWRNSSNDTKRLRTEKEILWGYPCDDISLDGTSSSSSNASTIVSASSYISFGPRRGRRGAFQRTQGPTNKTRGITGKDTPVLYSCTFCPSEFRAFYLWKRHELSAHAPQEQWVCGLGVETSQQHNYCCPICTSAAFSQNKPYNDLICPHRFEQCWRKPKSERSFFRRDALWQHIRGVHCRGDPTLFPGNNFNIDQWMEDIGTTSYDLTCHFCGIACGNWRERVSHIRRHFEDRVSMRFWVPGGPYIVGRKGAYDTASSPGFYMGIFKWLCPLIRSFSSTHHPLCKLSNEGECKLCGVRLRVSKEVEFARPFAQRILIRSHVATHGGSYRCYSDAFATLDEFIKHLEIVHSGRRGDWMIELIIASTMRD